MDYIAKLFLHTGAYNVTVDEVALAPTPERTRSHVPVPHIRLIELLENSLDSLGIKITSQEHGLTANGARYFGLFGSDDLLGGIGTMIGLRNSHDMSFPASLVLGTRVFVCDNLSFSGQVKLARKHTTHIERDLPGLVMRGAEKLIEYRGEMTDRVTRYQALRLSETEADHAICTLVRGRGLMPSQVGKVLDEFATPTHKEHLGPDGEHTLWTLYNAVTSLNKEINVFALPKRSEVLHGVCDSLAAFGPSPIRMARRWRPYCLFPRARARGARTARTAALTPTVRRPMDRTPGSRRDVGPAPSLRAIGGCYSRGAHTKL